MREFKIKKVVACLLASIVAVTFTYLPTYTFTSRTHDGGGGRWEGAGQSLGLSLRNDRRFVAAYTHVCKSLRPSIPLFVYTMFRERKTKYTASRSATRLSLAQRLVSKQYSSNGVPKQINRLLVVPGPDGQYNKHSQNMLSYLLQGEYGRELDNTVVDSEALEDTIFSLGESSVDFYHSAEKDAVRVARKAANWPNKTVFCPDASIADIAEECELFKIKSFIHMVRNQRALGITAQAPVGSTDSANAVVEQWPLAQAYGLDEFKTGGFLTMKHNVIDVTPGIDSLISNVDAHAMDRILAESVDRLTHHWDDCIAALNRPKVHSKRLGITEDMVGEPIQSFYEFAKMRLESGGSTLGSKHRRPMTLFGKRTNGMSANPPQAGEVGQFGFGEDATVGNAGHQGRPALHMVAEGVDPATGLAAARSYFFGNGTEARSMADPDALVDEEAFRRDADGDEEQDANGVDASLLAEERFDLTRMIKLYACMAQGLRAAMVYENGKSLPSSKFARQRVLDACEAGMRKSLPDGFDFTNNLRVDVSHLDAAGRSPNANSLMAEHETRGMTYVRVELKNIPSVRADVSTPLGSLLIGDTFTSSAFKNNAGLFVLTQNIPYIRSWICSNEEEKANTDKFRMLEDLHARHSVTGMGEPLKVPTAANKIARVSLLFGGALDSAGLLPSMKQATIQFFEHGVAMSHQSVGTHFLSFAKDVLYVKLLHAENMETSSLLLFGVSHDSLFAPSCAAQVGTSGERELAFVLPPYDDVRQAAIDALKFWLEQQKQEDCDVGVTFTSQVGVTRNLGILSSPFSHYARDWAQVCVDFVGECVAADISGASAVASAPVAAAAASSIPVTVLTGVPGSGKHRLAQSILDVTSDSICWSVFRTNDGDGHQFDQASMHTWCKETLARFANVRNKEFRMLVVAPGLNGAKAVEDALFAFPGGSAAFHIASSVSCVNLGYLHSDHGKTQFVPGLIELCTAGWTTHIALLGCASVTGDVLEDFRAYLREVNGSAEFIRLLGGGPVTGQLLHGTCPKHRMQDIVLSQNDVMSLVVSSYGSDGMIRARRMVPPPAASSVNQVLTLSTFPSLYKQRFVHLLETITCAKSQLLSTSENISENANSRNTNAGAPTGLRAMQLAARQKVLGGGLSTTIPAATAEAGPSAVSVPDHIKCFSVFGKVKIAECPGKIMEFGAFSGKAWLTESSECDGVRASEFVFFGENMKRFSKSLTRSLNSCVVQVPTEIPVRTQAMVTREEMLRIKEQHLREPASDGYMFDGSFYTAPTGDRREFNPRMDEFVAEFLAEENTRIRAENKDLARRRLEQQAIYDGKKEESARDLAASVAEEEVRLRALTMA
jgi:hypothetical protein